MAVTFKENMLLVYHHQEPEFMPLMEDVDICKPMGLDFVNEVPDGGLTELINEDWFGQKWQFEPTIKASNPAPEMCIRDSINCVSHTPPIMASFPPNFVLQDAGSLEIWTVAQELAPMSAISSAMGAIMPQQ